jgi:hypothetical protein
MTIGEMSLYDNREHVGGGEIVTYREAFEADEPLSEFSLAARAAIDEGFQSGWRGGVAWARTESQARQKWLDERAATRQWIFELVALVTICVVVIGCLIFAAS